MATFPAIQPNTGRSYGLGTTPQVVVESPNGDTVPFLWAADVRGVAIVLRFEGLTLTEADQILDHYLGQRGSIVSFDLPAAVWLTHTTSNDVFPTGTLFRYASLPRRKIEQAGFYSIEVSLIQDQ